MMQCQLTGHFVFVIFRQLFEMIIIVKYSYYKLVGAVLYLTVFQHSVAGFKFANVQRFINNIFC